MTAIILNTLLTVVSAYNGMYVYSAFCAFISLINIVLYYKQEALR